jgi:hypothetical protein
MINKPHKRNYYYFLFFLCALFSCELNNPLELGDPFHLKPYQPSYSLPVAKGEVKFENLLSVDDVSFLVIDEDGFYRAIFNEKTQTEEASNLIQIPNQSDDFNDIEVHTQSGENLPQGSTLNASVSKETQFNFNDPSREIRQAKFHSGNLILSFNNLYHHDAEVIISFPGIIHDNSNLALTRTIAIPADGNQQVTIPLNQDYTIDLTKSLSGDPAFNNLTFEMDITLTGQGGSLDGGSIEMTYQMVDLVFNYLKGRIGELTIPRITQSIPITVFDGAEVESMTIYPRLFMDFENSFGLPIATTLNQIFFIKSDGSKTRLKGDDFNNPFTFEFPKQVNASSEVTEITATENNSNIHTIFDGQTTPKRLDLELLLTTPQNQASENDFIKDDSKLELDVTVEVPMKFKVKELVLSNAITFNGSSIPDPRIIKSLKFVVGAENSFPFAVDLRVEFLDEEKNSLGDLFLGIDNTGREILIPAPAQIVDGKVITPHTETTTIEYSAENFEKVKDAKFLLLSVFVNTPENGLADAKIFADNMLKFTLGVQTTLNVDVHK